MTGHLEADDFDEADSVSLNLYGPDSVKRCISLETAAAEEAQTNKRKCGESSAAGNTELGGRPPSKQDNHDGRTECRAESQQNVITTPETRRSKSRLPDETRDHIRRSGVDYGQSPEEGFAAGNRHLLEAEVGRLLSEKKTKILPRNETSTFSFPRGGAKNCQNGTEERDCACLERSNESPNESGSFPGNQTRMKTNITSDMTDSGGGTNKDPPWGNKLFQAVVRNDRDQVRQLCRLRNWKQYLNKIDNSGNTTLMLAAEVGLPEMAELLVELGADAELRNDWGETALYVASVSGQLPESALVVRYLVRTAPPTVNVASNNGQTPIFAVAGRCETETTERILKELIRAGADLNRQCSDEDVYRGRPMTPFELAVTLGNFHHAEMLYEAGCDFLPVLIRYKQLNCYPDSFKAHPTWYNKIRNWTANPRSLKDTCGLKIRKYLRGENPGELLSVLPSSMVNYLNALSIQS